MEELKTAPEQGGENKKNILRGSPRYIRELSIVVLGVAITFLASGWITDHRERKELQSHLEAVKIELNSNLELVKKNFKYYYKLSELSNYIRSEDINDLSFEDIERAGMMEDGSSVTHRIYYYMPLETVSFEALKQSGTAKHINNQDIWRSIMKTYKNLEQLKHENDTYMNIKVNYMFDVVRQNGLPTNSNLSSPGLKEMVDFYGMDYHFYDVFAKVFDSIEETLSYL